MIIMNNEDNLIPFDKRTEEEQRAIAIMGGKASGEARRRKKAMREMLSEALQIVVTNSQGESKTLEEIGAMKVAEKYAKGDLKAAEFIARLLGEYEQKVKVEGEMKGVQIVVKSDDEAQKLEAVLNDDY